MTHPASRINRHDLNLSNATRRGPLHPLQSSRPRRNPLWLRLVRFFRLWWHLLRGLYFVSIRFPRWTAVRRDRENRRWSRQLLGILAIRPHYLNLPESFPPRCLLVLNHVSWLDIIMVNAVHPAMFIAKAEISRWPLVGMLVTRAGTLYIDRGSRSAVRRTNERLISALHEGALVACFPEGTTTLGDDVAKFHAALFQPAIDAKAEVVPAVLRYLDADGVRSDAAAYVGEDSLLKSIWMLVSAPRLEAQLEFLPPMATEHVERRALAAAVREAIAAKLRADER